MEDEPKEDCEGCGGTGEMEIGDGFFKPCTLCVDVEEDEYDPDLYI